jgi:anti-sigma B factor antagonist
VHRIHLEDDIHPTAAVLVAEGELDAYTEPMLRSALEQVGLDRHLVLDLSAVSFLDSTALGALVKAVRAVDERGGQARVVLPATTARRIFEITTLDRVLPVAASRADALGELASD